MMTAQTTYQGVDFWSKEPATAQPLAQLAESAAERAFREIFGEEDHLMSTFSFATEGDLALLDGEVDADCSVEKVGDDRARGRVVMSDGRGRTVAVARVEWRVGARVRGQAWERLWLER
jgi:acyl-coenzyme A thioesterase PaaI-like protein